MPIYSCLGSCLRFLKSPPIFCRHISNMLFTAVFFVLICIPPVFAGSSFPVKVRSEYYNSRTHKWDGATMWIFRQESRGRICVSREGSDEPVIVLTYDPTGRLKQVEKSILRGNRFLEVKEHPQGPIVLSEGFPVPFDDLSPFDESRNHINISRKAGGMTFSYRVTREITGISPCDAVSSGMVDQGIAATIGVQNLRLITIRKAGAFVVRQLWADGDVFWLYEETPVRRSWRVKK